MTLRIDGSRGEGGGQILRTSLALAAVTGSEVLLERIRARRRKPGLAPQHLTAVRAAAAICDADVEGAAIGSTTLRFSPRAAVRAGRYDFDVAREARGGSAGAATLVLQTVVPPLASAAGDSTVTVRGGTHVPWSPPADYLRDVWLPMAGRLGLRGSLEIRRCGFYPAGEGELVCRVDGRGAQRRAFEPLRLEHRGELRAVAGRALAARLPERIARRMAEHAAALLAGVGVETRIAAEAVDATTPGAGIFLASRYAEAVAGFGALGERGVPAESVAGAAVSALLRHHERGAALDEHLADQLVLPLALAAGESLVSADRATGHLRTNVEVIEAFGVASFELGVSEDETCSITVRPAG